MDIITQINREDEEEDAQLNAYADKGKKRTAASASISSALCEFSQK
jgi:hypothetical protein